MDVDTTVDLDGEPPGASSTAILAREDRGGLPSTWLVHPFSSAISFPDWKELQDQAWMWPIRETYDPLIVRRPTTWLLAEGWKLAGEISAREVPSRRR